MREAFNQSIIIIDNKVLLYIELLNVLCKMSQWKYSLNKGEVQGQEWI